MSADRNPAQDKRLTPGDIALLKRNLIDPEELKEFNAGLDLFKDAGGWVYVKPLSGAGPGDPTYVCLKALE